MKTNLGHIVFSVDPANLPFYRDALNFLGWATIYEGDGMLGVGDGEKVSLWFGPSTSAARNDYDAPGVNHVAIAAGSVADVDAAAAFLRGRGVQMLFDTPRHRPDFSQSPEHTYYQIMFESPDRLLFEVVYMGPKDA